jgi:hypothetical protein
MRVVVFGAIAVILSMHDVSAQDRIQLSIDMLRSQTVAVQKTIVSQRACIAVLNADGNFLPSCSDAQHEFMETVVLSDMSVYLDEVGAYAQQHQDLKMLDIAQDFLFFDNLARQLSDEISNRLTGDQQMQLLRAAH